MNILIIGGAGFIGSNVAEALLSEGHIITIVARKQPQKLLSSNSNLKIKIGDRDDFNFMKLIAAEHFDAVIDMAAYKREQSEALVKIFRGKTARILHTSTVSIYMVSHQIKNPISEDQDKAELMKFWGMNPFGMQYGIDKRECEDVLWIAHDIHNFPVTCIRPPYVCGPYDPAKRDYFWIERILDGKPILIPGSGDYASQNLYVKDLAKAYTDILKSDKTIGHSYNVASEEIFSLNDYLDNLCNLLGRNPERVNVDIDVFFKLPFSVSKNGHAFPFNTFRTAIFSIEKIKRDIGYKSTPFLKWMPGTIDWYKNEYKDHSVGYESREEEVSFLSKWRKIKNKLIVEML